MAWRFRADGWPYCPRCGEDELYSLANPATVETIVGCYRCNWKPVEYLDQREPELMAARVAIVRDVSEEAAHYLAGVEAEADRLRAEVERLREALTAFMAYPVPGARSLAEVRRMGRAALAGSPSRKETPE